MQTLRKVSAVLLVASALVLIVGSAGFSTTSADRGVDVSVAPDDAAYVGYSTESITISADANGTTTQRTDLVTVTNRFGGRDSQLEVVDLEYDITGHAVSLTDGSVDAPGPLGPGERGDISGEIRCIEDGTATVSVTVSVETTGISAELSGNTETREFQVTCNRAKADVTDVQFNGRGSFSIQSDQPGRSVDAVVWVWEKNGDGRDQVSGSFATDTDISKTDVRNEGSISFTDGGDFDIVAVEFERQENVDPEARGYVHPRWEGGGFQGGNAGTESCPVDRDITGSYLEGFGGCGGEDDSPGKGGSKKSKGTDA